MEELRDRTKNFALRTMHLVDALPRKRSADVIGKQLLRSATSVGANYRAARRSRSTAEFQAKLGIVEEEIDESAYWLELIVESGLMKPDLVSDLASEASQLTAIIVASLKTSKTNGSRLIKPKRQAS